MARYIVDIECNGLVPGKVVKLHCCHLKDIDTGEVLRFRHNEHENTIEEGVRLLQTADLIIGHNIIKFDIPILQQFYPWFKPQGAIFDTLVGTRLVYTDLKDRDFALARKTNFPKHLIGRHSLEAWGMRLMNYKGDYDAGWEEWNQEMDDYCAQDLEVTHTLYTNLLSSGFSDESFELEMGVARIMWRQECYGFLFNQEAAAELYAKLVARREELNRELQAAFPPWEVRTSFVPKVNNKRRGYQKGVPTEKVKVIEFNPSSRQHIAKCLIDKYGWVPKAFGDDGQATVDESILDALPYPEAKVISEYLTIEKRIGQLAEGRQAWLKLVGADGRIHGSVITNGAVTGRATHLNPNVAQVPAVRSPYGAECRALFHVPKGKKLVGADASGLELRCLAHYMARYDGGDYAAKLLQGDIHTENQKAAGLATRDEAKTFIYAFLYGAGTAKIGSFFGGGPELGKKIKLRFLKQVPALKLLLRAIETKLNKRAALVGLDGRLLRVRSAHAALNVLLQGAGAILMKKAIVIFDRLAADQGLIPGLHYEHVAWVHDEIQIEADEDKADLVGKLLVEAMEEAGRSFRFRCPITGEYKVGRNWAETH
jgi:DNA polymerase I-like protein with 3'-5' exonuclease and polymerase domains